MPLSLPPAWRQDNFVVSPDTRHQALAETQQLGHDYTGGALFQHPNNILSITSLCAKKQ